ncbi:MAG: 1,4-alpha-glucan branching protein GlgB [Clostridia bacterium]|nr:1,4-alpha-glucan branching protein GlgB [Clostridia bacterium]
MDEDSKLSRERFRLGESDDAYRFMGAHKLEDGSGWVFRVWAPNALEVSLTGDFNFWNTEELKMTKDPFGVWEVRSEFAKKGDRYQYFIRSADGSTVYKNDPYAFRFASLPDKAGLVWDVSGFEWSDSKYRSRRWKGTPYESPINIYEVHPGSWKRHPDGSFYTWRDLAFNLVPYVVEMGYTHIELMPVTEFPFEGSWGYQVTGYFAPTHRYGSHDDLKFFVNFCHEAKIGVILDWVPAHFPKDESGLFEFDGTCCYEPSDPVMNEHKEWDTRVFDYSRYEVVSFLLSSALFWIREYHADGIRVDAVASMLYLDYNRREFTPNKFGGNYNLEAIEFLKKLNRAAYKEDPSVLMIAEESTAFPMITMPAEVGGLGFGFKWNMGWMNDMLDYVSADPLFRKGIHDRLTFSLTYAFSENFILPLSHDEVVHGKRSLIGRMPGEYNEKFAGLREFYAYMIAHPGKKLSFMGNEFAQFIEWDYKKELDWFLISYDSHGLLHDFVAELNRFYLSQRALWDNESGWDGFKWIISDDRDNSVAAFRRISRTGEELICVFNFCPVARTGYRIGLPDAGVYVLALSSDEKRFGGDDGFKKRVRAEKSQMHGCDYSAEFTLPPLGALFYKKRIENKDKK